MLPYFAILFRGKFAPRNFPIILYFFKGPNIEMTAPQFYFPSRNIWRGLCGKNGGCCIAVKIAGTSELTLKMHISQYFLLPSAAQTRFKRGTALKKKDCTNRFPSPV